MSTKKTWQKGDTVYIRIQRKDGGAMHQARDTGIPLVKCEVSKVGVAGIPDCYGLRYADTKVSVGMPFFPHSFREAPETA